VTDEEREVNRLSKEIKTNQSEVNDLMRLRKVQEGVTSIALFGKLDTICKTVAQNDSNELEMQSTRSNW
jgi:hypothetical protein